MSHYRSNLRDIAFNLFEVNAIDGYLGTGPFADFDEDTARDVLREVERFAKGPWAESFVEGDRVPLRLEDGDVMLPPGVRASLKAFFDADWHLLFLSPTLGGMSAPPSISWAASELLMGANAGAMFYTSGPFFARIAEELVTPEQHARWIAPWVERQWGGTMVLTEPDAGSDVGAGRARAVQAGDGTWHLTGTKRFITSGDFDLPENIVHLVLARPEGAGPGTKGLSLFLVPKFWLEEDGSLGERNGVFVRRDRGQDGHQGVLDLRARLRRGPAGPRRARRRGSRRHRPDVQGHRVRPHAGRHQGDGDPLDRLPQRAGLRQGARPGP